MRYFFYCFCIVALCGCQFATSKVTEAMPVPKEGNKLDKTISVGLFIDNRFSIGEENTPEDEAPAIPSSLLASKEVRIPMGAVRSQLADTLRNCERFQEIISSPTELSGNTLTEMLKQSLETSDYLIVGEVNSFHIKNLGRNAKAMFTVPLDFTLLFIPNLIIFPLSQGKSLILTGGTTATRTVECILAISVTVYSVDTGHPLATFRIEERATTPADTVAIYGDLYNDKDDWIDIGRRLGEVALNNASVKAVDKVTQIISSNISNKRK